MKRPKNLPIPRFDTRYRPIGNIGHLKAFAIVAERHAETHKGARLISTN